MSIEYPNLPFEMNSLEPHMSQRTVELHYRKHHKKYVDTANELIKGTSYERYSTEDIMLRSFEHDPEIFDNVAQAWNHTFFWNCLKCDSIPSASLSRMFKSAFGGMDKLQSEFNLAGEKLFGAGWIWLVRDGHGNLVIRALENAGNPIVQGEIPLLTCDVWEHAYYLDYQNERSQYLKNFWKIVNWEYVEANFDSELPPFARKQRPAGDLTTGTEFGRVRATHSH